MSSRGHHNIKYNHNNTKPYSSFSSYQPSTTHIAIGIAFVLFLVLIMVFYFNRNEFTNMIYGLGVQDHKKIKDMDILYFMSPTCPWCQKMTEVLKKEGTLDDMTIVDATTSEGAKMATMYGAKQGLPTFISKTNRTGIVGFKPSTNDIVRDLTANDGPSGKASDESERPERPDGSEDFNGSVTSLELVLFTKEGCPWCTKAKDDLANSDLLDKVKILDITTTEGRQGLRDFNLTETPVPVYGSLKTKKHTVGYKPIATVVSELK